MSEQYPTADFPTFPWIYRAILLWTALESVAVFARPVSFRLTHEGWKLYTSDAVLQSGVIDIHAILGFMWIGVFLAQFELGHRLGVLTWVVVLIKIGVPLVYYRRGQSNRFALLALGGAFVVFATWGLIRGLMSTMPPPVLE